MSFAIFEGYCDGCDNWSELDECECGCGQEVCEDCDELHCEDLTDEDE